MVEPDLLVRAAGSFLFAPVGIAALFLAKGNRGGLALGAFLSVWGVYFAGQNVFRQNAAAGVYWTPVATALVLAGFVATLALFFHWPAPLRAHERPWARAALAVGACISLAYALALATTPGGWEAHSRNNVVPDPSLGWTYIRVPLEVIREGTYTALLLFLPMRFLASRPADVDIRSRAAWGAVLLLVWTPLDLGTWLAGSLTMRALAYNTYGWAFVLGVPLWLLATRAPQGHLAARVAIALTAFAFAGLTFRSLFPDPSADNVLAGVQRSLLAFLLAYAIARLGFLGHDLQLRTARRGTVAMAGLATLFIVAQIAQEFLSAQYGLLMGAIVAGALLFAASPIQRAVERVTERPAWGPVPAPESGPGQGGDRTRRAELYRRAASFAFRDGRISPEEELHLFELAQELGLGAGDAMRVRQDVERERRARERA